jgi:DNA-3-methyladenine glycosylase I
VAARKEPVRCAWVGSDPLMIDYHDTEWGVPMHDDRLLFEFLILDGAQAGLSWLTILRKRQGYRRAFDDFDPARVARYSDARMARLLADPGIVRNRLKIQAAIGNARAFLAVAEEFGSFDAYLWGFAGGRRERHRFATISQIPATSPLSDRLSRDLKARGFRFVGSTIVYAFLQAAGLVNDHLVSCFRHAQVARMR